MTAPTSPSSGARDDLSGFSRTTPTACVMCEACGFTFDADHTDEPGGGYTCPACAERRLEAEVARLLTSLHTANVDAERALEAAIALKAENARLTAERALERTMLREAMYLDEEEHTVICRQLRHAFSASAAEEPSR